MLREEKQAGSALGFEADRLTSRGLLVPDELINSVAGAWLERLKGDGFVFDGYPRTLGQAAALDAMLSSRGTPLEASILLEADFATLRSRVEVRLICGKCGNIASGGTEAAAGGKCPRCGGDFSRRADDNAATLEMRFREYLEKSAPVSDYYEQRGLLNRVDAARSQKQVFADVCRILNA